MTTKISLTMTLFLILMLITSPENVTSSAVLIADFTMSRMIELSSRRPFCKVHHDRGDIQRMLLSADPRRVRQIPQDSVVALENVCQDTSVNGVTSEAFQGGLGFIYPGTKWCGPGNLAIDYNDLGRYTEEDKCCREHDLCPETLSPSECRRGLCNTGSFTRSHCDCDAKFRRCLQAVNTETANTLGAVFFNVVQVTCFRERNPCTIYQRLEPQNIGLLSTSSTSVLFNKNNLICPMAFIGAKFYIPKKIKFISRLLHSKYYFNPNNIIAPRIDDVEIDTSNEIQMVSETGVNLQLPSQIKVIQERSLDINYLPIFPPSSFKNVHSEDNFILDSIPSRIAIRLASIGMGYNQTMSDELCSQWKYRPSEKYFPSAPAPGWRRK